RLVFRVEAAAAREALLRRVDGDVAMMLAIEQGDVFGLAARSRVSERVVAARVDLREEVSRRGQQRPCVAAQIAEIEHERLRRLGAENFLRAAQLARVD